MSNGNNQPVVPGLNQRQVATLVSWAYRMPRVALLAVFGSRARGTHTDASDVDLVIDLTEDRHETARGLFMIKRLDWNAELSEALNLDVRLNRPTPDDDGGIAEGVERDAITIFRRS